MTTDNSPSGTLDNETDDAVGAPQAVSDGASDAAGERLPGDVPAGSRLADLMAARAERLKKEELRLPVPTWKGALAMVLRPMTIEERKEFAKTQQAANVDEVTGGAAFIAACCTHVEMLNEDGNYVPILGNDGRQILGLHPHLAQKTGGEGVKTPAGTLQHLVNWNVAAIEGLFEKLYLWSQDTSAEIEGSILGE
jgi:hypothetical protein